MGRRGKLEVEWWAGSPSFPGNGAGQLASAMPFWSIYCIYCNGYIADALLECLPPEKHSPVAFRLLFNALPGAALACPYCNGLLSFESGLPQVPPAGWPVFRYGRAELEAKKQADGEMPETTLADWALRHRFTQPGRRPPFTGYLYAEQAPANEFVP
jgi:hypothetical protein